MTIHAYNADLCLPEKIPCEPQPELKLRTWTEEIHRTEQPVPPEVVRCAYERFFRTPQD